MAEITLTDTRKLKIRLTVGSLRRFELATKTKLFKALTKAWANAGEGDVTGAKAFSIFTEVFPGVDEVARFLYECSDAETRKQSFEDFCDDLPGNILMSAFTAITDEVAGFMPEAKDGGEEQSGPLRS